MELEEEMSRDKKALLEEFERRRKARQLNVSTDDDEVHLYYSVDILGDRFWLEEVVACVTIVGAS